LKRFEAADDLIDEKLVALAVIEIFDEPVVS